jgi:D-lactate dehydrogenase (cytochrome)
MLQQALAQIVGPANVLADEAARRYASSDIFVWPDAATAELVVRPGSTAETARAVALLADRNIVPRGAGLSYTAGVVPHVPAVVLDSARLDAIDIHAEDLYAVVGAGCTWEKLAAALKPHGLHAVQRSPISGSHSTVGGLASQNLPGGMDGVIGLTVVLADGTVARTGSAARTDASAFQRYSGPDLTGLFLGDCGAFGIKTEVVLRLAPEPVAAFASFGFKSGEDLVAAIATVMRHAPGVRAFGMDEARGTSASKVEAGEAAKILGAVVKGAGSLGQAVKDVAQLARGRNALAEHPWSLHLTAEGPSDAAANAELDIARRLLRDVREMDNVVPKTLRAKPYSIRGLVGPDGERWVPVHGVLPLSRARECMASLHAYIQSNAVPLGNTGVKVQWLCSSAGPYVTIEPMFYWRDALDPIQIAHLSERNRARFSNFPENRSAREVVRRVRGELRDVFARYGAVHAQVGRFYPLTQTMDAGSRELLTRIKHALDPGGRMNPGSLGL